MENTLPQEKKCKTVIQKRIHGGYETSTEEIIFTRMYNEKKESPNKKKKWRRK